MTYIPYVHGCAIILYMKRDPVDFVDNFFKVENFISTHQRFGLLPINGSDMWLEGSSAPVLPPPFKVQLGKPKKMRRREAKETTHIPETNMMKMRKLDVQITIQLYKGVGHNIRTCKEKNNPNFSKKIKISIRI